MYEQEKKETIFRRYFNAKSILGKELRLAEKVTLKWNPPKPERESKRKKQKKGLREDFIDISRGNAFLFLGGRISKKKPVAKPKEVQKKPPKPPKPPKPQKPPKTTKNPKPQKPTTNSPKVNNSKVKKPPAIKIVPKVSF